MKLTHCQKKIKSVASPRKGIFLQRFFKTGKGQYGYGDKFLGITVPVIRQIAKEFMDLKLDDVVKLLKSIWHEERLLALIMLTMRYEQADRMGRVKIYKTYFSNLRFVNNWDLVDATTPNVVGRHMFEVLGLKKSRPLLTMLARSKIQWERGIAVLATFYFLRQKHFAETLRLADLLLNDKEDLMHKAVGWMLREVGKRDEKVLKAFLKKRYAKMPRTMLRYSIEKFSKVLRQKYLSGLV